MSQLTRHQAAWGQHPGSAVVQASGGCFSQDQRESSRGEAAEFLSFNLLIKQWSRLRLLLYSSKISTMTMNLTPKASLGMARYPHKDWLGRGCKASARWAPHL